jgi:hypothetical protein
MYAPNRGGARRQLEHDGHDLTATTFDVELVQGSEPKAGVIEHSLHPLAPARASA